MHISVIGDIRLSTIKETIKVVEAIINTTVIYFLPHSVPDIVDESYCLSKIIMLLFIIYDFWVF